MFLSVNGERIRYQNIPDKQRTRHLENWETGIIYKNENVPMMNYNPGGYSFKTGR